MFKVNMRVVINSHNENWSLVGQVGVIKTISGGTVLVVLESGLNVIMNENYIYPKERI